MLKKGDQIVWKSEKPPLIYTVTDISVEGDGLMLEWKGKNGSEKMVIFTPVMDQIRIVNKFKNYFNKLNYGKQESN